MDVEPCYSELELAESLASSQQKCQTLNLADFNVMRQLLLMTLVCSPMCRGCMSSNPDRTSDENNGKLNAPSLAMNDKIVLEDLCVTIAAEVVENLSEGNEKGVDFE